MISEVKQYIVILLIKILLDHITCHVFAFCFLFCFVFSNREEAKSLHYDE